MTFAPRTWVVGEVVTAALMNQEIRDQWNTVLAAWTAYTPSWTAATTNPVLGNGTLTGAYMKIGRTCFVQIDLTTGGTTTYGSGAYSMSLPFSSASGMQQLASLHAFQSQRYIGQGLISASSSAMTLLFPASGAVSNLSSASPTVPFTWASGAQFRATFRYQTAT